MTYRDKLYFTFNNISSSTMGLLNVNMQGGLYEEDFLPTRTIKKTKIRGRNRSYLNEIEEEVRVLTVSFAFQDIWNETAIRDVANWLRTDYYKPMVFHENSTPNGDELIYWCICVSDSKTIYNGLKQGYLSLQFECMDSYLYSPVYLSTTERQYNYFISPTQPAETYKEITFVNNGDLEMKPIIIITAHSSRARIVNTTNSGQKIEFRNLKGGGEIITLDAQNEIIESSLGETTYRYNQLTSDSNIEFSFVPGNNYVRLYGDFEVQFKFEEAYLTST